VTAIAGRLWCGYACPQTVWTEAFLLMERWAEGSRARRMKLDQAPWNGEKIARKSLKQFMWVTFSLATGLTFVGYFTPIQELSGALLRLEAGPWESFWVFFYGFATYGNAGYLRAQVCKYMCPYARFQSAMFDKDTLVIAYDQRRGEPRGGRSRGVAPASKGLGDCIDCTLCVQVCPTGIDIREGLQYECIACAACIDVCDQVMDKMEYPRGLIKYTTEHAEQGRKSRLLRPRVLIYSALLLVICVGWVVSLGQRTPLRAELIRDRNALYRELSDSSIENVYALRLVNMDDQPHAYRLDVDGLEGLSIDAEPIRLPAEEAGRFTLRLRAPRNAGQGRQDIELRVTAEDTEAMNATATARFFLPTAN
jgi:cytochrome c oxidase accessory protein FixG